MLTAPKNCSAIKLSILTICVIFFIYMGIHQAKAEGTPPSSNANTAPVPSVTTLKVEYADTQVTYEYPGRASGIRDVEVRAQVSGILTKKAYMDGQKVTQGDLLFQIDPAPFIATLEKAEAQLKASQAALWNANEVWQRAQQLYKHKGISAQDLDNAKSAYDQALSNKKQFDAELTTAKINLDYTKVTAPITGIVGKEEYPEGSLISLEANILTKLTQLDPIYINFSIPDNDWHKLQKLIQDGIITLPPSGKLNIAVLTSEGIQLPQQGAVDFIDSVINYNTATVAARTTLQNDNAIIMPGQFVKVMLKDLVWKNAIVIPERALVQFAGKQAVYILDEKNIPKLQTVTLGPLTKQGQIIKEGLKSGDIVIAEGMIKVRPNQPIKVANAELHSSNTSTRTTP